MATPIIETNIKYKIYYNCRTALHWACKRNHTSIVEILLANGADKTIVTFKGERPMDLISSDEACTMLGCSKEERCSSNPQQELPFTPNYLQNPTFPYGDMARTEDLTHETIPASTPPNSSYKHAIAPLVVKVRVCNSEDTDFVEIEVLDLKYQTLLEICAMELEIDVTSIAKIRKLPDILVRKDRDVQRMKSGQELEVVLAS